MQLPEAFRRAVVVPCNDESARQLAAFYITGAIRVQCVPIPSQALFDELWNDGLLQCLNSSCQARIDDYEEEVLPPDKLSRAIATVTSYSPSSNQLANLRSQLLELLRAAETFRQPAYFIL